MALQILVKTFPQSTHTKSANLSFILIGLEVRAMAIFLLSPAYVNFHWSLATMFYDKSS